MVATLTPRLGCGTRDWILFREKKYVGSALKNKNVKHIYFWWKLNSQHFCGILLFSKETPSRSNYHSKLKFRNRKTVFSILFYFVTIFVYCKHAPFDWASNSKSIRLFSHLFYQKKWNHFIFRKLSFWRKMLFSIII